MNTQSQGNITAETAVTGQLKAANAAFERGEINQTWVLLQPTLAQTDLSAKDLHLRNFLQLGCAVYAVGDLDAANRLNATLALSKNHLPVRYRLAIRQKQHRTAKRLRTSELALANPHMAADFKTSAGIYCLWNKRYGAGYRLYAHRHAAIMFPQVVPKALKYAPLTQDPKEDVPRILLEQGVGDVVLYLAHIRQQGHHAASTFIGLERYGLMVRRWFPKAKFIPFGKIPKSMTGQACHCAADFLGRSWRAQGSLKVHHPLPEAPKRMAIDKPVYGICWRGGSGQNRREERHIPLQYFLDLLPNNAHFMPLQFDMTDDERAILVADRRVIVPFLDVTENPMHTIDLIRDLAGVISVDSANWHFAGIANVPTLAIMNDTPHWFWGPDARAEDTYPAAHTIRKRDLSSAAIKDWIATSKQDWRGRPKEKFPTPAVTRADTASFDEPLFIVSLPRSRSSMVMGAFAKQGVWAGKTVSPTVNNPKGFFENAQVRETYLKTVLKQMGADPLGVTKLPQLSPQPPFPHLPHQIRKVIDKQGYGGGVWGFKDPKLTLLWPMYAKAFPKAHWVILDRNREDVIRSMCRTTFLTHHSTSPEYWRMFCISYDERLHALKKAIPSALTVNTDQITQGDYSQIIPVFKRLGLDFSPDKMSTSIDRRLASKS